MHFLLCARRSNHNIGSNSNSNSDADLGRRRGLSHADTLQDLSAEDYESVAALHAKGRRIASFYSDCLSSSSSSSSSSVASAPVPSFRLGYHAIPSLKPLHLHIISEDFDAPSRVKLTKKHILSNTTRFFVTADHLENHLRGSVIEGDKVKVMEILARRLKEGSLDCYLCGR